MKAFIHVSGDWSVGIQDGEYIVEIPNLNDYYDEETREWLREELRKIYIELESHNHIGVLFEDECADCGKKGCKGECLKEIFGE